MKKIDSIKLESISKYYEGVVALKDVSCQFEKGKVYGLVGENGAGKSTLVKIINGTILPDQGNYYIDGKAAVLRSPSEASKTGIGMVYQELNLIPNLSVMENMFISHLSKSKAGIVDWKTLQKKAQQYLDIFHLDINPKEKICNLKVAYQQIIAIIRAYAMECSVLILDEPTSALPLKDIGTVLDVVRRLVELDCIVIYISHKLDEIFQVCDEIVALRNGEKIGNFSIQEITKNGLVEQIAGRKLENKFPKRKFQRGAEILRFEHVSVEGYLQDINFTLYKGEILGFAGLLGAGKTEIAKTVFGLFGDDYAGSIYLNGEKLRLKSPVHAIKKHIGLVPENRGQEGLIHDMSLANNTILASLPAFSKYGYLQETPIRQSVNEYMKALQVKCSNILDPVKTLSGGNQQKIVLAKWLAAHSHIIIFDEPTRGIDVGAKYEIYNLMNDLVEKGVGVMIMSSENDEVLNMCDRVVLLKDGCVVKTIDSQDYTEEEMNSLLA